MTLPPEENTKIPFPQDDILLATEALFLDIASASDAPLKNAVLMVNKRRRLIGAYEGALIPNRDEELRALKACWAARDIPRLKDLIMQYYKRRSELAPQIVEMINRSAI